MASTVTDFPTASTWEPTRSTLTPNFPHLLDEQSRHIAPDVIGEAGLRQATAIEPTAEAEAGWVQTIKDTARTNLEFRTARTPGYYNGEAPRRRWRWAVRRAVRARADPVL